MMSLLKVMSNATSVGQVVTTDFSVWISALIWAFSILVILILFHFVIKSIPFSGKEKKFRIPKYLMRFYPQIVFLIFLSILLYPIYSLEAWYRAFMFSIYHAIRFFVIEGDVQQTFDALRHIPTNTWGQLLACILYHFLIMISCVLAPFFTITAIMSVFKSMYARIRYLLATGEVHVFSELNEKSFALANSILIGYENKINKNDGKNWFLDLVKRIVSRVRYRKEKPVIVFTDVLEPTSEVQYDLQESAEYRGAICFRNDLESIKYSSGNNISKSRKRRVIFYLINEDETEKIRHATHVLENYDYSFVSLYIFSDKIQSRLLVSMQKKNNMERIIRIDDIQSLVYYNLHKHGLRLFETAKWIHKNTHQDENAGAGTIKKEVIRIRTIIIGFGRYGTEMFKALLWLCQVPGYELEIHLIDNKPNLKMRLDEEYPDLMAKNAVAFSGHPEDLIGDSIYRIYTHENDNKGIDVNTVEFSKILKDIQNPTYIFVALGKDEENIQVSSRVREFYQREGMEPDIETVVYDSNLVERMSCKWPLAGCFDAAYMLFADDQIKHPFRKFQSKEYQHLVSRILEYKKALIQQTEYSAKNFSFDDSGDRLQVTASFSVNTDALYNKELYGKIQRESMSPPKKKKGEKTATPPPDALTEYTKRILEFGDIVSFKDNSQKSRFVPDVNHIHSVSMTAKGATVTVAIKISLGEQKDLESLKADKDMKELDKACERALDEANKSIRSAKSGVINAKKQPYNIHMIGDLKNFYTKEIIINNELLQQGYFVDRRWVLSSSINANIARQIYAEIESKNAPEKIVKEYHGYIYEYKHDAKSNKKTIHPDGSFAVTLKDSVLVYKKNEREEVCDSLKEAIILSMYQRFKAELKMAEKIDKNHTALDGLKSMKSECEKAFGTLTMEDFKRKHLEPFLASFLKERHTFPSIETRIQREIPVFVKDSFSGHYMDFLVYLPCNPGDSAGKGKPTFTAPTDVFAEFYENHKNLYVFDAPLSAYYSDCSACPFFVTCQKKDSPDKEIKKVRKNCTRKVADLIQEIDGQNSEATLYQCGSCSTPCAAYLKYKSAKESLNMFSEGNYYQYEYNQRSSITKYMHEILRFRMLRCGYLDDELDRANHDPRFYKFKNQKGKEDHQKYCSKLTSAIEKDPLTIVEADEQLAIGSIEHIRWNAYMRTEGYSFKLNRDDLAKHHNNLLPLTHLFISDIRKDV